MKGAENGFSNSDMSYDTKTQKNRPEPLSQGVALSTVFFVEEPIEEEEIEKAEDDQPPSKSSENDAD